MNVMRTGLLLAAMTGLFLAVGYLIGGQQGMVVAFLFAAGTNLFAYWNSDKMVLRMHNAEAVDEASAPELFRMVRALAERAGIPMPKVYLMHEDQPNAFATGRNPENGAVAVTTGLLRTLNPDEVAGVVAHELAHIKHRDTLIMTVTATLAGAISMLGNFAMFFGGRSRNNPLGAVGSIAMIILAPLAAMLVQMAISRTREYAADRGGAEISGQPLSLATALGKISDAAHQIPNEAAEASPATAHMFIINPLSGAGMDNLFSTHPNPENRIAALEQMAAESGSAHRPSAAPVETAGTQRSGPWSSAPTSRRGPWG